MKMDCYCPCFGNPRKFESYNGASYAKADYMRNLILLKREVFGSVRWNENLLFMGEHLDYFLELKHVGFSGSSPSI